MPKASEPKRGLLDTWGRANRKLEDKRCEHCGKVFRPRQKTSRYCSRPCQWANNGKHQKLSEEVWWLNNKGYIEGRVLVNGKVIKIKRHRWVMEQFLGRPLSKSEIVHHKDGNKSNNDLNNLEILEHGKHTSGHNQKRIYKKGYKMNISDSERQARSQRMKEYHLNAALAKATL